MSDELLLAFGCVITFIAAGGAYVALRSDFAHGWMSGRSRRSAQSRARQGAREPQ